MVNFVKADDNKTTKAALTCWHCSKPFTSSVNPYSPNKFSIRCVLLVPHFTYEELKTGLLSNLMKVMQPADCRVGIRIQAFWLQNSGSHLGAILPLSPLPTHYPHR